LPLFRYSTRCSIGCGLQHFRQEAFSLIEKFYRSLLAGYGKMVGHPGVSSLTAPRGGCCSSSNFRIAGYPPEILDCGLQALKERIGDLP
jgi:hypothetical protein